MRLYLRTFGCRANQYDSERVRALATAGGAELVDRAEDADVAVFNSCAVTSEAERDLRKGVRRASRENGALRTVVMGCAAALDTGGIASLPGVSDVVAGADLAGVARALGLPTSLASRASAEQSGARALLRVQDGCDAHCTFCATTLARGANRSRPVADLVREARALAEHHNEIVLTGVHVGTYGADVGLSLGTLVETLVLEVPRVRFRLASVEATEVDARLFDLLTGEPAHVAPYLHAPLQSGSDAVLRRMGRSWYTSSTYAAAVERLCAAAPVFGLGADVIAGFPGETEADHAATLAMVEALPFTGLHVFPYSERESTAATRLEGRVDHATIARRAAELRAVGATKRASYEASRAGGTADVVVTGRGPEREGLTGDYLTVSVAASAPERGARFSARLDQRAGRLVAVPLDSPHLPHSSLSAAT